MDFYLGNLYDFTEFMHNILFVIKMKKKECVLFTNIEIKYLSDSAKTYSLSPR